MEELWERFELWLSTHAKDLSSELHDGATEWEIEESEATIALDFPQDLKDSLLIHDGGQPGNGLIGDWELLCLREMTATAIDMEEGVEEGLFGANNNEASNKVKGYWWNPNWIPIVSSGSRQYICIDMDPAKDGVEGQVILFLHDEPHRPWLAPSYKAWMKKFITELEQGHHNRIYDEALDVWEFPHPAFLTVLE